MAVSVTLTAGDSPVDQGVGYTVWGASYSNYGSQWLWLGGNRYAAPNSRGTFYIDGDTQVHVEWKAPPNTAQPPAATTQFGMVTFTPLPLWDSGTASAPKGLYYDRNPTSFKLQFSGSQIAPHVSTVRASYTVPASRKAFLESAQVIEVFESVGDLVLGSAGTAFQYTPSGGVTVALVNAFAEGLCPVRTTARAIIGTSIGLLAGDLIEGKTNNTFTATKLFQDLACKGTEFDA